MQSLAAGMINQENRLKYLPFFCQYFHWLNVIIVSRLVNIVIGSFFVIIYLQLLIPTVSHRNQNYLYISIEIYRSRSIYMRHEKEKQKPESCVHLYTGLWFVWILTVESPPPPTSCALSCIMKWESHPRPSLHLLLPLMREKSGGFSLSWPVLKSRPVYPNFKCSEDPHRPPVSVFNV